MGILAQRAFRGAAWTIVTDVGARMISLVGTLVLTRFLTTAEAGEVSIALIVVWTATFGTNLGFGAYVISRRDLGREGVFHVVVVNLALAAFVVVSLTALAPTLALLFPKTPKMADYIPALALAMVLWRIAWIPEQLLARELKMRSVALTRAAAEIAYTVVTIGSAYLGYGGWSLVYGNLARTGLTCLIYLVVVELGEWLTPCRLRWARLKDLFRFGLPMAVAILLNMASRSWDNLLFGWLFGADVVGRYNLAYNLADLPATYIGEHIGDVLLPSFAQMDLEKRPWALVRATGLLSLIVVPMAIGLGSVAPEVTRSFLPPAWWGVAPMLAILSVLAVTRPIWWALRNYLASQGRTRTIMILEAVNVAILILSILALGQVGPHWACAGAGIAFGTLAFFGALAVHRVDDIGVWRIVSGSVRPLLACVPVALGILGTRHALLAAGLAIPPLMLAIEILVGIALYIPSALVLAPTVSRDFLSLLRDALPSRKSSKLD